MMDMHSKHQYIEEVRKEYLGSSREVKSQLLDEAVKRTAMNRKYLIRRLAAAYEITQRKKRSMRYGGDVGDVLVKVWEIFDYPCGQRLEAVLKSDMILRLEKLGEVRCGQEIREKLSSMGSATIDRLLAHERQVRRLNRYRGAKINPLLYQKIPMKTAEEWDREKPGNVQLDYVLNGGASSSGTFVHTLSAADIATGWWEGEALMGRSQQATHDGLDAIRKRLPFRICEIHPDNDSGIINQLIYGYCQTNHIAFSRSRPNKKNDNAWVEQRNYTHVRKLVGYLRYDTKRERLLLNSLYREFALYRNFCQPSMKLVDKERRGGKVKRTYDMPQTPYQRLRKTLSKKDARHFDALSARLNPAALKRSIEKKRSLLYQFYQQKMKATNISPFKKLNPTMVTFPMIQQPLSRLPI